MIRSKKEGSRRRRVAVVGGIAASAVMAFGVSSASAATQVFSATFDDAALNLPTLGTTDILNPPPPATMTGTVDDTNGNFNVPMANFVFPPFSGTAAGLAVTVHFAATQNITGNVNSATGVITTNPSNYHAQVAIPALSADCPYDLNAKSFTTGPGSPFNGHTFTVNTTTDWVVTQGILQTGWPSIPASGAPGCAAIDGIVSSGPGGLEMGNGFDLTPEVATPPDTGAPVAPPAKKKCKKAKKKHSASASKKKGCKKKKKK